MRLIYFMELTVLVVISIIDIREKQISGKALVVLLLGGIAAIIFNRDLSMSSGIGAMLLIFIVLWIVHRFSKGSLGMGDVKLCAVTALYLGVEKAFGMLALSMILCGITAAVLIVVDKGNRYKSLPFAPFVTAGTLAILLL